MSDAAAAAGGAPFGFAEFALVGVPLTDATADRPASDAANMMVMGPAGYRFGDYGTLGLPVVGVFSS